MRPMTVSDGMVLLDLSWRVLRRIVNIPRYSGIYWSGMLRFAYQPFLKPGEAFHTLGLVPLPADVGQEIYPRGSCVHLGMKLPEREVNRFLEVVASLPSWQGNHGHFVPGDTLKLETIVDRKNGKPWPRHQAEPFVPWDFLEAAQTLSQRTSFRVVFTTPLRREKRYFGRGDQRLCDLAWFNQCPQPLKHLLRGILPEETLARLSLKQVMGWWQEIKYGKKGQKSELSGFVGYLEVEGQLSIRDALQLICSQWDGLGTGKSFGHGQYRIPEIEALLPVAPMDTSETQWARLCRTVENLWDLRTGMPKTKWFGRRKGRTANKLLGDVTIQRMGVANLRKALLGILPRPRCWHFKGNDPGDLIGLGISCELNWQEQDLTPWLHFLEALFPGEPLVRKFSEWRKDPDMPDATGFPMVLNILLRGLLEHCFGGDAIDLPNSKWDVVVAQPREVVTPSILIKAQKFMDQLGLKASIGNVAHIQIKDWMKKHGGQHPPPTAKKVAGAA